MSIKTAPQTRPTKPPAPLTGEELFALGDIGRAELVEGELIRLSPTGHRHGQYEVNFVMALGAFVRQHKMGRVLSGEVGIYIRRNPDTVRGADVAFISNERLAQVQSSSYLDVAPELVVEILSPDDRWFQVKEKLAEYFDVGVRMVWVADPPRQQIHLYRSLSEVEILDAGDELAAEDLLPGFSVPVAALFE